MAPRIPAHVFGYSLASIPGIMYALYYKRNVQTDEEFEEMLRKNYSSNIESSKSKREDMMQFMSGIKDPGSDQGTERRMAEALAGGRGQAKRHYAVNKELYGTEEGVKQRNMAEEEQRKKEERRKRRTKGSGVAAVDGKKPSPRDSLDVELKPRFGAVRDLVASIDGKQVAVVTSVGFLAVATGFVVGGRRQ